MSRNFATVLTRFIVCVTIVCVTFRYLSFAEDQSVEKVEAVNNGLNFFKSI